MAVVVAAAVQVAAKVETEALVLALLVLAEPAAQRSARTVKTEPPAQAIFRAAWEVVVAAAAVATTEMVLARKLSPTVHRFSAATGEWAVMLPSVVAAVAVPAVTELWSLARATTATAAPLRAELGVTEAILVARPHQMDLTALRALEVMGA
jgi:hypothetical protein